MYTAIGYAAQTPTSPLAPMTFERRAPRPDDVAIEILYCGVCHSDIHQARNEWGIAVYPLMPGHEIIGRVTAVGDKVTSHKVGDLVASAAWSIPAATAKPAPRTWSNTAWKARP